MSKKSDETAAFLYKGFLRGRDFHSFALVVGQLLDDVSDKDKFYNFVKQNYETYIVPHLEED